MDVLPGEKIIGNVKFQHLYLTMNEKSTTNCFILKLTSNAIQGFKIINLGNYEIDVKQQTVFYITNMVFFINMVFLVKFKILSIWLCLNIAMSCTINQDFKYHL